jgi:hypothetical protein
MKRSALNSVFRPRPAERRAQLRESFLPNSRQPAPG